MKNFFKILAIVFIPPLLIGLIFFDNIKGYYRFKNMCEAEGGLRVYEKLERNVGWLAKDQYDAQFVLGLSGVGFARYSDKDGVHDLFPVGGRNVASPQSEVRIANMAVGVIYSLKQVVEVSSDDVHAPAKIIYKVQNIMNDRVALEYAIFIYEMFDSRFTPLEANEKISCFDESRGTFKSQWKFEIESNFIK